MGAGHFRVGAHLTAPRRLRFKVVADAPTHPESLMPIGCRKFPMVYPYSGFATWPLIVEVVGVRPDYVTEVRDGAGSEEDGLMLRYMWIGHTHEARQMPALDVGLPASA